MQKPRQSYTLEFKHKAVALGNKYYSTIRAARELGTSAENIRRWKNQLDDGRHGSGVRRTTGNKHLGLKRLRKELAEVKMQRDILRKGASFLCSETQVKFEFIRQHRYCLEFIPKSGLRTQDLWSFNSKVFLKIYLYGYLNDL